MSITAIILTYNESLHIARAIRSALHGTNVPLLINDRVDVALAAGADGVHLGADDMKLVDARRLLGPRAIIGATLKHQDELPELAAAKIGVGVGNFYAYRIFKALGIDAEDGAVRLSFVHYTSRDEVNRLIRELDRSLS